jgi:hypothetical protein
MSERVSREHRPPRPFARVLQAVGRVSLRALQVLLAALSAMSNKVNAPLLPPDTKAMPPAKNFRP